MADSKQHLLRSLADKFCQTRPSLAGIVDYLAMPLSATCSPGPGRPLTSRRHVDRGGIRSDHGTSPSCDYGVAWDSALRLLQQDSSPSAATETREPRTVCQIFSQGRVLRSWSSCTRFPAARRPRRSSSDGSGRRFRTDLTSGHEVSLWLAWTGRHPSAQCCGS
jgi:hypothetical protein